MVVVALDQASRIAIPTVLAVLAAIALAPLARRLEALGAPAWLAAALIVAGALTTTGATLYVLAPSAEAWNQRAPQILRDVERKARQINREVAESVGVKSPGPAATAEQDTVGQLVEGGQRLATDFAIGAPGLVGGGVYWAFLTFFLLSDRPALARRLMSLGVGLSAHLALGRAMREVQANVSRYLLAITVINIALGLCVAGVFHLIGMPSAALWGVAAALLNFMPYLGPIMMALVALGVGFVSFDTIAAAFAPVLALVALNTIEGQVVTPMLVGARMRLSALSIFLAIAFGAWLWGASGALIATPTLIVARTFFARLDAASRPPRQRERREKRR